jgi:hypothetical protein
MVAASDSPEPKTALGSTSEAALQVPFNYNMLKF